MKCLKLLFPGLLCYFLILARAQQVLAQNSNLSPVASYHIGVILDMGSSLGRMVNGCISMGTSDFYAAHNHYKTRLVLHPRDSMGEPIQALSLGVNLMQNNEVQAIIGPQTSNEAEFLVDLGVKAEVPIISFSATSPFLSHVKAPYFVRVASNDISQVNAIAALVQDFRWREVVPIYEDTAYGNGVIPHLVSALDEIRARVPYRSVISPSATDNEIVIELYKLMTMSTRVFVVHMSSSLASRVFSKVKELRMMSKGYAWIVTDGITNMLSTMNSSVTDLMQGVLGIRPYLPPSAKLKNFTMKLSGILVDGSQSVATADLNRYCLWAYDAVWAISGAAERVGAVNSEHKVNSSRNLTNLTSIPVSQTGSELLKIILQSKFDGVSGSFELINGEMQPLAFEIVNVVEGIKGIGFWTPGHGISQVLGLSDHKMMNSDSIVSLSPIWPGVSLDIPRGWILPVSGKILRIGFPVREGFMELVKLRRDPQTNAISFSGFCVDVFDAVISTLPYAVPYEVIPFASSDGDYNDLIYQVHIQKFDAVVGDITITSNRSLYVDFTLPFTEGGVAMVVPTSTWKTHSIWIFLEPLTVNLWLVIVGFVILTGLIVWAIEHGSNTQFKCLTPQQVGRIIWYSFSTLVFMQGEKLRHSLSKFVVIMWIFVVFILTSSYTASLSSMLTARQLEQFPTGGSIGYRSSYFVTDLLNNLNFEDSRRKLFNSTEDYADALKKGSENGGVSAIIDEIPYIKIFLAKYHADYTMINAEYYSTSGFGFAFPKGSPLVPDFSRAIAKLREDGKLNVIEKAWFGNYTSFIKEDSPSKTDVLSAYNFRGLFLIMGITSILAFIMSYFFMENKPSDGEEAEVDSKVLEEPLPKDDMPLTLVILDCSSDEVAIEGEDNEEETEVDSEVLE